MIDDSKIKINEGERRVGKDEMNLIELPFTLLTQKNPKGLKTIERTWKGKAEDGTEKKFYKIISGSDKWGLPTFIGEELYLACMELSYRHGFESRTVYTSKRQLLELMGWGDGGLDYKRLTKALNQLLGIVITTNAFWDNQEKKYKDMGFGIIDNYMFDADEKRISHYGKAALPLGNFSWNEVFFEHSIKKGNIKTLDTALYFSLKGYISKRLYRFIDKKLYNQNTFELDLFRLAFEKLEMIGEAYDKRLSKIIQNLQPAFIELRSRNIANIQIKPSTTESGYKVCFSPITKPQITVEQTPKPQISIKSISVSQEYIIEGTIQAASLVKYFHSYIDSKIENYNDSQVKYQPTKKELQHADKLLKEYGEEKAKYIIEFAVNQAKQTKFQMVFFGAVIGYASQAISQFDQEKEALESLQQAKSLWIDAIRTLQTELDKASFDIWVSGLSLIDFKDNCFLVFDECSKNHDDFKQQQELRFFPKIEKLTGKKVKFIGRV